MVTGGRIEQCKQMVTCSSDTLAHAMNAHGYSTCERNWKLKNGTTATIVRDDMERKPIRLTPLGNVVVVLCFIVVMGIIGWIEGL